MIFDPDEVSKEAANINYELFNYLSSLKKDFEATHPRDVSFDALLLHVFTKAWMPVAANAQCDYLQGLTAIGFLSDVSYNVLMYISQAPTVLDEASKEHAKHLLNLTEANLATIRNSLSLTH